MTNPRRLLGPHLWRYRWPLAFASVLALLETAVTLPAPLFIRHLLDEMLIGGPAAATPHTERLLALFCAGLALLAGLRGIFTYGRRVVSQSTGQRIVHDLRVRLLAGLERMALPSLNRRSVGRLMPRFLGDMQAVYRLLTRGMLQALSDGLRIALVGGLLFWMNGRLTIILLPIMVVYVAALRRLGPRVRETSRDARREVVRLSGTLQTVLSAMPLIKSYNLERYHRIDLERHSVRLRTQRERGIRAGAAMQGVAAALVTGCGALVLWAGSMEVLAGRLTHGGLVAYYTYIALLFGPLRRIAQLNEGWERAAVTRQKLTSFLAATEQDAEPDGRELVVVEGCIEFRQVTYGYEEDHAVLTGVDLTIEPGTLAGLAGPNGCGKSTLLGLLLRWDDPWTGSILIDGQDLRTVRPASIRRQVGVVLQNPLLLPGTIEENIQLDDPTLSADVVASIARLTGVLAPDSRLELRTPVGERGHRLSLGERQRISLARALVRRPRILLLDEASTSLTEDAGLDLPSLLRDTGFTGTAIFIEHRSDLLDRLDCIWTLKNGTITRPETRLVGPHPRLSFGPWLSTGTV